MKDRPTLLIIASATTLVIAFLASILKIPPRGWEEKLVSPFSGVVSKPTPIAASIPPKAPKTYSFDSSTDLKQELETVDPKVLDSDFD